MRLRKKSFSLTPRIKRSGLALSCASVALLLPSQVIAQPVEEPVAETEEAGMELGVVTVTALRREQSILDTPLSVSALGDAELEARNVVTIEDFQFSVPGLSSTSFGPAGSQRIQLRGLSASEGTALVGIYVDETPIVGDSQQVSTPEFRLIDVERVEVLRGPQATLYGEGSMGGTIRYITRDPLLDEFSGNTELEVNSVTDGDVGYRVNGVANIPLAKDKVGLRLVAGYEAGAGWIDNSETGEENTNEFEVLTLRAKLLAELSDNTTVRLLGLFQDTQQDNQNFGMDRVTASPHPTPTEDEYYLVTGQIEHAFDSSLLTINASLLERENDRTIETGRFFAPFLTPPPEQGGFGFPEGFITEIPFPEAFEISTYTGEIRLQSDTDGPFNWIVGGTLRYSETLRDGQTTTAPGEIVFPGAPEFFVTLAQSERVSESQSIYAFGSYDFNDRLSASLGGRFFQDKVEFSGQSASFGFAAVDPLQEETFDTFNPQFGLSYRVSDQSNLFFNASKGFRSGGFNSTGGDETLPAAYEPDEIWTYEVGSKSELFDGKLSLEGAVYYSEWNDVQTLFFVGASAPLTTNGGLIEGYGVDAVFSWRPTANFSLSGTYGWNNLEHKVATADKEPGDPVDFAVQEAFSISSDYQFELFGKDSFARLDYQHSGGGEIIARNFGQFIEIPERDLVNLRLGTNLNEGVELSVFANNLFDEDAPVIEGVFGVIVDDAEARPRTVGLQLRSSF